MSNASPGRAPSSSSLDAARRALIAARDEGDPVAEVIARCCIHHAHKLRDTPSESWWASA